MAKPEEELQAFVPGQLTAGGERVCCDVVAGDPELQCNICKYVMENPMFLGCCAKFLCQRCVESIQQSRILDMRRCPFCQQGFTSLLNQHLQKRVHGLLVKCPNDSRGCSWQGKLIDVQHHISPQAMGREDGCPFQVTPCSHRECTAEILRKDLRKHEDQLCQYRTYTCKFCLDVTDTYHKVSTEHFPVCPDYTVPCRNKGCPDYMARAAVQEHLSTSCSYEEVACDYVSAGCNIKGPRKDLHSHCETASHHHNKLMLQQNTALQEKLAENELQLSKVEELLRQQDLKHQQQLSLMGARLDALSAKSESHLSVASRSGDVKKDFAEKMTKLEHNFAHENYQLRNELTGVTAEVFLLKDSHADLRMMLDEVTCKGEAISHMNRECQKLSDSFEAVKLGETDKIECAVVQQIGPVLYVMDDLREKITDNQSLVHEVQKGLDYVEKFVTPQPPFGFTVSRFSERKFNKEPFVSPAFYTHRRGYKVCVRVDLHGMNNHVAVHCCIMRGEHDDALGWPFRGDVQIHIQNQLGNHTHYLKVISFDDATGENRSGRVLTGDKNYLHGFNQFISHQELGLDEVKGCQYLKGDAIDFEVVKIDVHVQP